MPKQYVDSVEKRKTPIGNLTGGDKAQIRKKLKDGDPEAAFNHLKYAVRVRTALNSATDFDAVKTTSKRRKPRKIVTSLDASFGSQFNRDTMVSTARDLIMNFSLGRGLIQTHINNVVGSGPRIQFKSKDPEWNTRAEKFFQRWGRTCDVRGVLNWGRYIRMVERRTVVDGDVGIILSRGLKLQGIEADRIANPPGVGTSDANWVFGVKVDDILAPKAYGVYNRGNSNNRGGRSQQDFDKEVAARNFVHSFDPERFDQSRGISALISAINDLQDTRETLEAVKGSIKLENILALVFKLKQTADQTINPLGALTDYDLVTADGGDETRKEVKINEGINTIEIGTEEEVTAVKKETPNNTFNEWMMFEIRLIAMALDMPLEIAFHFYTRGSFSSLKGAIGQYHTAIHSRRSRLEDQILSRIAIWVIQASIKRWKIEETKGVPEGERKGLEPPADDIIPIAFSWQWDQLPFLEPDEQAKADEAEYKLVASSLADINAKRGRDWEDQMLQRAREFKKAQMIAENQEVPIEILLPQTTKPGEKLVVENPKKDPDDEGDD